MNWRSGIHSWWISRACQGCQVYLVFYWPWHISTPLHRAIHGTDRGVINHVGTVSIREVGGWHINNWTVSHLPSEGYGFSFPVDVSPEGLEKGIRIAGWSLAELRIRFGDRIAA